MEIESDTAANTTSNISVFSYLTFALQVQNINLTSFKGHTFNVDLGSVEEAMKRRGRINDSALITLESATDILHNATASIYISEELLEYCFNNVNIEENVHRLSYAVFLTDAFFQTPNSAQKIGSLIIAARLNCSKNSNLPVGIDATFRFDKNVLQKCIHVATILAYLNFVFR